MKKILNKIKQWWRRLFETDVSYEVIKLEYGNWYHVETFKRKSDAKALFIEFGCVVIECEFRDTLGRKVTTWMTPSGTKFQIRKIKDSIDYSELWEEYYEI